MASDSSSSSAPSAIQLALQFYRVPLMLREWIGRSSVLPEGVGELLRLAGSQPDGLQMAAAAWRVDSKELGEATRFFLQQVLLQPGSNHYRVLGVAMGADDADIRKHHRLLMRVLHPDRNAGKACWTDGYAARVNDAYRVLRRADTRADYDESLFCPLSDRQASVETVAKAAGAVAPVAGIPPLQSGARRASFGSLPLDSADTRSPRRGQLRAIVAVGLLVVVLVAIIYSDYRSAYVQQHYLAYGSDAELRALKYAPPVQKPRLGDEGLSAHVVGANESLNRLGAPVQETLQQTSGPVRHPGVLPDDSGAQFAAIPEPRDVGSSVMNHRRVSLLIPPSRKVELPASKNIPALVEPKSSASHGAAGKLPTAHQQSVSGGRPRTAGGANQHEAGDVSRSVGAVESSSQSLAEDGLTARSGEQPGSMSPPTTSSMARHQFGDASLMALLGHLVRSYQQGDLATFIGLFAVNASTTDEANRQQIEAEYRHLFSTTRMRHLEVSALQWRVGATVAKGDGIMVIKIGHDGTGIVQRYEGRFSVNVVRERQQLRIAGLFYDLERM